MTETHGCLGDLLNGICSTIPVGVNMQIAPDISFRDGFRQGSLQGGLFFPAVFSNFGSNPRHAQFLIDLFLALRGYQPGIVKETVLT